MVYSSAIGCVMLLCHARSLLDLQVLVNSSPDSPLISTHDLLNLLAILEQNECRHSPDPQLLRYIGYFINIDLEEVDAVLVFLFLRHARDLGGDHLAGPAPGGEAVEEDDFAFVGDDGGVERGLAVERVNAVRILAGTGRSGRGAGLG